MRQLRWSDVRLAIITSALVLAGYLGIIEGFNALHISTTLIRRAATAAQLGYGILALIALAAILRQHRVAGPLLEFWGSMFTATTIVVPPVRGDGPLSSGLRAGVITALVVMLLIWLWRANQRLPSNHPSRRIANGPQSSHSTGVHKMPLQAVAVILAAFTIGSQPATPRATFDNPMQVFSGAVAPGSWFRLRNHKGAIEVRQGSGNNVVVYATRRSDYGYSGNGDPTYDVLRDGSNVTLCVNWPDTDRCDARGYSYHSRGGRDREVGSVDLVVELPRGVKVVAATGNGRINVRDAGAEVDASSGNGEVSVLGAGGRVSISSGNGELQVEGAHGDVDASTGNGDVKISTSTGPVSVSTGNGRIDVDMATLKSDGDMEFSTGNGSIEVKFPSNLSAIVEASGSAKDFETDFPMQMDAGWSSRHLEAKIGNGGRRIRFSTGNGHIRIRKSD